MPIYEYKCSACSTEFERLRSFGSADQATSCPECNCEARRKLSVIAAVARSNGEESLSFGGGGGCAGCSAGSCAACHQ